MGYDLLVTKKKIEIGLSGNRLLRQEPYWITRHSLQYGPFDGTRSMDNFSMLVEYKDMSIVAFFFCLFLFLLTYSVIAYFSSTRDNRKFVTNCSTVE